jgi:integrase
MKGSIGYAGHVRRYYVAWYHPPHNKTYKIYHYKGEPLYDRRMAQKLLACMQADVEKSVFRIEQYTKIPSNVGDYLKEWLKAVKPTLAPATYKDYRGSIENYLIPFFEKEPIQLHEVRYDTLVRILNSIKRGGKGKLNVMYCLHACLDFAWRSGRIPVVPPFPKRKAYNITDTPIVWLPEDRQRAVIEAIPTEHQPIFWWLKFHLRRPCEAASLHKVDFDGKVFIIHRSFSDRQLIQRTKTGEIHYVPMVDEFIPYYEAEKAKQESGLIVSPYFFINPKGERPGQPYTGKALSRLWKEACAKVGESIPLYPGVKHSSCSQLVNEHGYSIHEVQMATDHARLESVKRYAKVEVSARKALLEKKVIKFKGPGMALEGIGRR